MVNINGATALVTGGQRGLGKAFVRELLDRGARKVYATARKPEPTQDPRIVPVDLDVTDEASVGAAADLAGDVSIVVNNAGVGGSGPLLQADLDDIEQNHTEVLVDDASRHFKQAVAGPVQGLSLRAVAVR